MMSTKIFLTSAVLLTAALSLSAQDRIDPDSFLKEFKFEVGVQGPMKKSFEMEPSVTLSYAHFRPSGFGWRAGLQYMPVYAEIDEFIGLPLSISWRTRTISNRQRLQNTAVAAGYTVMDWFWDWVWGWEDSEDLLPRMLAAVAFGLFSRGEFSIGVTPGLVMGDDHMTEWTYPSSSQLQYERYGVHKRTDAYLSLDASYTMSWRIWRFNLHLTPGFHYNLVNTFKEYSYREYASSTAESTSKPLRWMFSVNGGLSWMF